MNNQEAYNSWANNYDSVSNFTRDLEGVALRAVLWSYEFEDVLEIGCGTGKNTGWLLTKAKYLIAADFSEEMLEKAKAKITDKHVEFRQTDIRREWDFNHDHFNLITVSLALEHIEDINFVFQQVQKVLKPGGLFYIGELHPFKQYQGSKARFETQDGVFQLECFLHHVSDYFAAAKKYNLSCIETKEWFDDNDRLTIPRILSMVFQKPT